MFVKIVLRDINVVNALVLYMKSEVELIINILIYLTPNKFHSKSKEIKIISINIRHVKDVMNLFKKSNVVNVMILIAMLALMSLISKEKKNIMYSKH